MSNKRRTPPGKAATPKGGAEPDRKQRKETWLRARQLDREIPWLVHRHNHRLTRDAQWTLCDGVRELRGHLKGGRKAADWKRLVQQVKDLDKLGETHLASVRKSARRQYFESIAAALLVALFIRAFLFEAYRIPSGSMIPTLEVGDYLFVSKFVYGLSIPFTNTRFWDFRDPDHGEVVIFGHPRPGPEQGTILIKRVMAVGGDRIRMEDNVFYVNGEPLGSPRVMARQAPCRLSPGETCNWISLDGDSPPDLATAEPRSGCPCTFMEESKSGRTWVTQRPWPSALCGCRDESRQGEIVNFGTWPGPDTAYRSPGQPLPGATDFPTRGFMRLWPDDQSVAKYIHYTENGRTEMEVPDGHVFVMGDNRDNSDDGRYWGVVPLNNIKGKALFIWWASKDFLGRVFHFVH